MHRSMIPGLMSAVACSLIFSGAMITTSKAERYSVAECHSKNIMLDCPPKAQADANGRNVDWFAKVPRGGKKSWQKLASIHSGREILYTLKGSASSYTGRLSLHENGSLEISSLRPDDETQYRCDARRPFQRHVITLNVSCDGKNTESKRQVCTEEDIILDCPAKDRTNPRKLGVLKWHQRNSNGRGWTFLVSTNGSKLPMYHPLLRQWVRLHHNGSLVVLRGGRRGNESVYMCEVNKKNGVSTPERHKVTVKSLTCRINNSTAANSSQPLRPCMESDLEVPCPIFNQVHRSQIRSLTWRIRPTTGRKQLLFSTTVRTRLRRSGSRKDRVFVGPNGTLILKRITAMDEGEFECIVKTFHHHEGHKHRTAVKPVVCPVSLELNKKSSSMQITAVPTMTTETRSSSMTGSSVLSTKALKTTESSTVVSPTKVKLLPTTESQSSVGNSGRYKEMNTSSLVNGGSEGHHGTSITTPAKTTPVQPSTQATIKKVANDSAAKSDSFDSSSVPSVISMIKGQGEITPTATKLASDVSKPAEMSAEPITPSLSAEVTEANTRMSLSSVVKPTTIRITTTTTTTSTTVFSTAVADRRNLTTKAAHENGTVDCGGILTSLTGEVQSPNFPNAYPTNMDCKWLISIPKQYNAIRISIEKVSLEHDQNCMYDYVEFQDELGNQVGCRHCGLREVPTDVTIKGGKVVVHFHSDRTVSKSGFHLTYSAAQFA